MESKGPLKHYDNKYSKSCSAGGRACTGTKSVNEGKKFSVVDVVRQNLLCEDCHHVFCAACNLIHDCSSDPPVLPGTKRDTYLMSYFKEAVKVI